MTLIKSISGIRGTIGGQTGDTLNPLDIVKFTTAYATFIARGKEQRAGSMKVVVGRDGRISGPMVRDVVCAPPNWLFAGIRLMVVSLSPPLTTPPSGTP